MGSLRMIALFGLLSTILAISGQQTTEIQVPVDVSWQNVSNSENTHSETRLINNTGGDGMAGFFDNLSKMFGNTSRMPNGSMETGSQPAGSNGPPPGLGDFFNTMASMFKNTGFPGAGRMGPGGNAPGSVGMRGQGAGSAGGPGIGGMGGPKSGGARGPPGGLSSMLGSMFGMGRQRPGGLTGPPQNWSQGGQNTGLSGRGQQGGMPPARGAGGPPSGGPGGMMDMFRGMNSGQGGGIPSFLSGFGNMQGNRGMSSMIGARSNQGRSIPQGRAQNPGGMGSSWGQQIGQSQPMGFGGNPNQQPQQWSSNPQTNRFNEQQAWGSQTGNWPQQHWGSNLPMSSFPSVENTRRSQRPFFPNGQQSNPMSNWGNGQTRLAPHSFSPNTGNHQGNRMVGPQRGGRGGFGGVDTNMLLGLMQSMVSRMTGTNLNQGPPPSPKPGFCREYDCPPFTVLKRGQDYELRRYEPMTFASADIPVEQFAKIKVYWTLAEYMLQGKNSEGVIMPLTVPILTKNDTRGNLTRTMYFLLPYLRQKSPPIPIHPWVKIVSVPAMEVYVRPARGYLSDGKFGKAAEQFRADLGPTNPVQSDIVFTAFYDTMFKFRERYNELWLVSRILGNDEIIATHVSSPNPILPLRRQPPSNGPYPSRIPNNPPPNNNEFSNPGFYPVNQNRNPLQQQMVNMPSGYGQSQTERRPPPRQDVINGPPNGQAPPNEIVKQNPPTPNQQQQQQRPLYMDSPFNRQTQNAISPPGDTNPNSPKPRAPQRTFETAVDSGSKNNVQFVDNLGVENSLNLTNGPRFNTGLRGNTNPHPAFSFNVRPGINFF